MEFKGTKEKINELEIQKSYLTDIGLRHLFELKELLKQRNEMLEMLEIILDCQCTENKLQSEFNKQIQQLIEEATKID